MGNSDVSNKDDVSQIARRLSCTASSTAQVLYTVAHIESHLAEAQILKDVAQKSYALAAALSSLQEVLDASGEQGAWTTKEHGDNLLHSMRECDDIFRVIGIQVRKADQEFKAQVRLDTGGEVAQRVFDDERDRKAALDKCLQLVVHTNLLARHSTLVQKARLVDDEIPQALRLTWAFEHPALAILRANKSGLLASAQLQEYCLPSPAASGSSADKPKSQSDPTTLTVSSTQIEESTSRKPALSTYNQWPPFGDPQHPAYLATMTLRPKDNSAVPVAKSSVTSTSTSKESLGPFQSTGPPPLERASQADSRAILFGQPSVIKPTTNSSSLFGGGAFASFSKDTRSNVSLFTPASHLEGYILRPIVQSTDTASTLSYEVDSLPIGEDAMHAQVHKLGNEHSVLDALLDLQPQQRQLIQLRATQRRGTVVSIQIGKPFDLSTLMGPLQVRPIVFIISTTTMLPEKQPLFPSPATTVSDPPGGKGLFKGLFAAAVPTTGFGSNIGFGFDPNRHLDSPEAYSQRLQEQGEPCTYVEGTDRKGAFQHYQTITMNKDWHNKDRSLEEIRLADYHAGRKGPMKTNGIFYPWDKIYRPSGLWGFGPPTSSKVTIPTTLTPAVAGSASGAPELKKGLFGQLIPSASSVPPSGPTRDPGANRGPFSQVAPALPPFVPPTFPPTGVPGRGLFGGNREDASRASPDFSSAKTSTTDTSHIPNPPVPVKDVQKSFFGPRTETKQYCTTQHQHSVFCRLPTPPPTHQVPLHGDETGLPPKEPAKIGQHVPATSPGLFGLGSTTSAKFSTGRNLFGAPANTSNESSSGAGPTVQPPAAGLFGGLSTTQSSNNVFGSSVGNPGLFGTAPHAGGLFGQAVRTSLVKQDPTPEPLSTPAGSSNSTASSLQNQPDRDMAKPSGSTTAAASHTEEETKLV